MKHLVLTGGKVALVDDEDYDNLSQFHWYAHRVTGGQWYARCSKRGTKILLHRYLMLPDPDLVVDHANGDGLDNRRQNLRIATRSQNEANTLTSTGYRGVSRFRRRWRARIKYNYVSIQIGTFDTPEEAARAYDEKALELWGEFAQLNFAS